MKLKQLLLLTALLAPVVVFAQNEKPGQKNLEFYAGVGANITNTTPDGNYKSNGGKSYTSVLPKISVGINAYGNPMVRKFYLTLELSAGLNKYQSVYDSKVYPYSVITYGYNQMVFALTPQASLNIYNTDNFKWFIGAGLNFQYSTYSSKKLFAANGSSFAPLDAFDLEKFHTPVLFKTGITLNQNIQIHADYLTKVKLSKEGNYYDLSSQTIQVGVNYEF